MANDDRGSRGRQNQRRLHASCLLRWIHQEEAKPDQEDLLRPDAASQGKLWMNSQARY